MKKNKVFTSALVATLLMSGAGASTAMAAVSTGDELITKGTEDHQYNSTGSISFTENTDVTPPIVDPKDPQNPGTNDKGPLSLDQVPNLPFGGHKAMGAEAVVFNTTNKQPKIQVSDTRGTSTGWTVNVKASEFKSGTNTLTGASLAFKASTATNLLDQTGAATNPAKPLTSGVYNGSGSSSEAPVLKAVPTLNADGTSAANIFGTAKAGDGLGTWVAAWDPENVQLSVPSGVQAVGDYTSTLTWTLNATPMV